MSTSEWDCSSQFVTEMMQEFDRLLAVNKICSSRTKAAVTADLTSDPLEFVEDLEQDLNSSDSMSQRAVSPTVTSSKDLHFVEDWGEDLSSSDCVSQRAVSPADSLASSEDLHFIEDWGEDLSSCDCMSHKAVSPAASVASIEDIRSAESADLTAVPLESMAMAGMETPSESSLLAEIYAALGPSGAENVAEAAQEVLGDEVIDIRDPFLAQRDSESVSQTPALIVSEERAAEPKQDSKTIINKLYVKVLVQNLVTRTFKKAGTDANPRPIADRLFDRIWAEMEGEDFETLPETFRSHDKNVFKDLCQHWGSAQMVLVSMYQDEPRVDNYIASTFKCHLMTPAKRHNAISRFFSRVGKVISQPFTAHHRRSSHI
ncbi:hypothetical protein ABVT39_020837 [Epinephelus coioides]